MKRKKEFSDMAKAYRSGIQHCFPYAQHTIDKFHVKKLMLDAMDEVRKSEQKEQKSKALHLGRRVIMVAEKNQNEKQKEKIAEISKL